MNAWFGYKPFAAACVPDRRVHTPIGAPCLWCADPIMPDDNGFMMPMLHDCGHWHHRPWHLNCQLRSIIGGVNHQRRICHCFGGDLASDPAEMTPREAADAAVAFWFGQDAET